MKRSLVEILLRYEILRFGSFTTKSGRQSPYFFNTGLFCCSESLGLLADLYAEAILQRFDPVPRFLFGPAYKGIPLAVMVADRLAARTGQRINFTFNRKEAKDHGEGGLLLGHPYQGGEEVLIIEDVLTGGTSLRASVGLLRDFKVKTLGAFVAIDREERGQDKRSAKTELEQDFGLPVFSLITLREIVDVLTQETVLGRRLNSEQLARIEAYRSEYGGK